MSSKGVVLSQKRIFHNKQFLQKGFSTCICHLNVSSCCAFQTVLLEGLLDTPVQGRLGT